jgi:lipoprotein signal peptidase
MIAVDQASKFLALHYGEVFRNYHFAFSLPLPSSLMYGIYMAILLAIIVYVSRRYRSFSRQESLAWVLVFAGSLSNIGERIILGYVRDFIYLLAGIFNFADFYILLGMVLLVLNVRNVKKSLVNH